VHALYIATFDAKCNHAALTARFFAHLADLGDTVQLALARDRGRIVAMALFLRSTRMLYGRYWGSTVELPGLHFELCYYRGIDYAIAHELERFEPGAQGEHKLARGFLPARTHSRHYLADARLRDAVRASLSREARALETYIDECLAHSPYAQR
jgi:predicted N-acyltransferase